MPAKTINDLYTKYPPREEWRLSAAIRDLVRYLREKKAINNFTMPNDFFVSDADGLQNPASKNIAIRNWPSEGDNYESVNRTSLHEVMHALGIGEGNAIELPQEYPYSEYWPSILSERDAAVAEYSKGPTNYQEYGKALKFLPNKELTSHWLGGYEERFPPGKLNPSDKAHFLYKFLRNKDVPKEISAPVYREYRRILGIGQPYQPKKQLR